MGLRTRVFRSSKETRAGLESRPFLYSMREGPHHFCASIVRPERAMGARKTLVSAEEAGEERGPRPRSVSHTRCEGGAERYNALDMHPGGKISADLRIRVGKDSKQKREKR